MKIIEYEQDITRPLREATILLLLKEDEVLLAMKKRGFGEGKWNGVGGKPNSGESIEEAAAREAEEEIGIVPKNMKKVAVISFHFPLVPEEKGWGQKVSVFTTTEWVGEPKETEEMRPKWFKIKDIPYKEMWWDDEIWMPKIFGGSLLKASFMFGENEKVDDFYVDEVESLD